MNETISEEQLITAVRAIGVKEDCHLALGVSMKSIGQVEGGPETLIKALLKCIGPRGTLMVNTFSRSFSLELLQTKGATLPVFDPGETSAITGMFAERFRHYPGAVRSGHPTNSVAAIGSKAEYLTACHNANSPAYSPYSSLAGIDGKMLCIGIGDDLVALRHQAQYLAGLLTAVPCDIGALYKDKRGRTRIFKRRDRGGCTVKLPLLVPLLRRNDLVKDGQIGHAASLLVDVKESLRIMTDELEENAEHYLCEDSSCGWCRELEIRLEIYKRFPVLKTFQKYAMFRSITNSLARRKLTT